MPTPTRITSGHRRGSVYIAVIGTSMMVAMMGLTAIHLSHLELRAATTQSNHGYARLLAQSGVEMAMSAIDFDVLWRTTHISGVEYTVTPLGMNESLHFRLIDTADGNLGNDITQPVEIQGIGRYGDATFVCSVIYAPSVTSEGQVGPIIIKSYDAGTNTQENVTASAFKGQHFIPSLPPEAISWGVVQVDVYLQQAGAMDESLLVKIHTSDASGIPQTLLQTASFTEAELPTGSYGWHPVGFSNVSGLTPGAGLCLTLEGVGALIAASVPYHTSVTQTDSHMLRGGSGSWSTNTSQSIQYRVHGVYTTANSTGNFAIIPGSWQSKTAP